MGWKKNKMNDELAKIGFSKASSNISIHGENGMYISHTSIAEIKTYGTIQEYLKQQYGPGKYTVTVKGSHGKKRQHISIAENQEIGIYLSIQAENARLKAELEALRNAQQSLALGQIIPALVVTASTECLETLKGIKTLLESHQKNGEKKEEHNGTENRLGTEEEKE